jgi:serine/threonine protein kinase
MDMQLGTQLGTYRLDALLGEGGMARVYKAWHTGLHRHEALKLLLPQMASDRGFVERFLTEARTAANLRHPNIATIHTVSQPGEQWPYFTMEMIVGEDLADLLTRCKQLRLDQALPVLRQIADALDHAHRKGIVHRDVKPANVLMEDNGDGTYTAKVVDFGIARAQESEGGERLTKAGMIVGTPEYMSPEQGGSGPPVDHRTDIYSLGVIAYEMLCGRPPFAAGSAGSAITVIMSHIREAPDPPIRIAHGLPEAANDAVLKALAKDPTQRFKTCGDFVSALAAETLHAAHVSEPRHRTPVAPWVLLGVAAVIGVVLIFTSILRSQSSAGGATSAAPAELNPTSEHEYPSGATEPARETNAASEPSDSTPHTHPTLPRSTGDSIAVESHHATIRDPATVITPPLPHPSGDEDDDFSSRRLTIADVIGKSAWDMDIMRNDIYARHGYRLKRPDLSAYFSRKPWYHPDTGDPDVATRRFSQTEKYNVKFILSYEKDHGLRY